MYTLSYLNASCQFSLRFTFILLTAFLLLTKQNWRVEEHGNIRVVHKNVCPESHSEVTVGLSWLLGYIVFSKDVVSVACNLSFQTIAIHVCYVPQGDIQKREFL